MTGVSPSVERTATPPRRRLWRDRRGATAVEYGFIVALIVIAMIASFKDLANATVGLWGNVNSKVANATGN